jgi:hypothetical protein
MKPPILGNTVEGSPVSINIDRLVETRMLIQANSGAGKSWAIRRILEQTYGRIQHLVIDVEDEFHTLREKFDYVLAGRHGGDCPADVRSAQLLARRLLELGTSAIIGIYELKAHDRIRFARLFLESLIDAPRNLWHPVLVVVDEAHMFCPQNGEAESAGAVKDLMTRGRKRGFCGVLAVQRLSKLHKDAAAEANNKLIGRSALDVDMARAADELGFSSKDDKAKLRTLQPGQFFVFGPAISDVVIEVRIGPVETTHPKAGQRATAPVPPPETVRKVLAQLADLPKEAEQEAQTAAELRRRVLELERELRAKPKPEAPAKIERVEVPILKDGPLSRLESAAEKLSKSGELVITAAREIADALKTLRNGRNGHNRPAPPPVRPSTPPPDRPVIRNQRTTDPNARQSGPEQRILDAIAWLESLGIDAPEQVAVAFLAGYTYGGGGFNNPRGALRTAGLVEYIAGDRIRLTEEGRGQARFPEQVLSSEELQSRVLQRLPGPERKILEVILRAYPDSLTNEECAEQSGYTHGGGGFNNPRGRLRTLGLIDYPQSGQVRARKLLFLEGGR